MVPGEVGYGGKGVIKCVPRILEHVQAHCIPVAHKVLIEDDLLPVLDVSHHVQLFRSHYGQVVLAGIGYTPRQNKQISNSISKPGH